MTPTHGDIEGTRMNKGREMLKMCVILRLRD
jgi:hypothetical protein